MSEAQDLKARIQADMVDAMRTKDTVTLGPIRLLKAEIKKYEIDQQVQLDNTGVISIIQKMIKQRQESIHQFRQAKREDLAEKEESEIRILQGYLPAQLSTAELENEVEQALRTIGATTAKEMGKVMTLLKDKLAGRADMSKVSEIVKRILNS